MSPRLHVLSPLWLLSVLAASPALAQPAAIEVGESPTRWTIRTAEASYQVVLGTDGNLVPGHFGADAGDRLIHAVGWDRQLHWGMGFPMQEVPVRGGFVETTPVLEVVFADGVRELELRYTGYEVAERDGYPLLRLDQEDAHYGLRVSAYLRAIPELDVVEKWLVIENGGAEPVVVEKAASGSIVLPPDAEYDLIHVGGDILQEFVPRRTPLTPGTKTLAVRTMKSQQHPPLFMARPRGDADLHDGPVWFGQLAWSGNWRVDADVNRLAQTQITAGINFWDTTLRLDPGAAFETPRMIVGWAGDGTNGAARRMHRYVLDHVLPEPARDRPRPVLYNSWYATEFDVDVEGQVALAEIAADLGVELFVIDDGWFEGRTDATAGLGDWRPDRQKFPDGLGPLVERVRQLGMEFGIWVEPEMVSPDSDLYRARPEWALQTPNRTTHGGRGGQLVLNMAREDVKQFTLDWLDRLLSEHDVAFLKWDMNRHLAQVGWPDAPPGEERALRVRYVENLYGVLATLRARHPDVLIESCSSGGGRVDAGVLRYADQFWASDNTDPVDRLTIQHGAAHGFPAKTVVSWVTDRSLHGPPIPLRFRFHVAMAGNLGVGTALPTWSDEERGLARTLIADYKALRPVVQEGDQYWLGSPLEDAQFGVQFVARDRSESAVFAYQPTEPIRPCLPGTTTFVLHGLDAGAQYRVEGAGEPFEASGRSLMGAGVEVRLRGSYASEVLTLRRVSGDLPR